VTLDKEAVSGNDRIFMGYENMNATYVFMFYLSIKF